MCSRSRHAHHDLRSCSAIRDGGDVVFTYACTNGASVAVIPTSPNYVPYESWEAKNGANNLTYTLWNSLTCQPRAWKRNKREP